RGGRLQWGRARASAEIAAEWAVVLNPRRASMGPRSCERGNPVHRRLSVNIILCFNGAALVRARKYVARRSPPDRRCRASMGPRSCERGNGRIRSRTRASTAYCFNGAALVRARKYVARSFSVCVHFACFNGAALVRARKFGRERCGYSIVVCASMGPRSCERGNDADQELVRRYCEQLQWGRARASAEIATFVSVAFPRHLASMGPRSCERGNNLTTAPSGGNLFVLQWGRARASAEMEREQWRAREIARLLQWGRARASAEI